MFCSINHCYVLFGRCHQMFSMVREVFIKVFSCSWKTWTISWWCCWGLDDGVGGTDVLFNPTTLLRDLMHLQAPASPACGEAVFMLWVSLIWSSLVGSYFWLSLYSQTLNSPLRCSCYVYILTASAEKRPKHQPLHIKQYLCSLKILRMCFLAVWISQKPLPEYIFSIWSTSAGQPLLVNFIRSHFFGNVKVDSTKKELEAMCKGCSAQSPTTPPTNAMTPGWWLCR